jgi:hypothetical protein
MIITGFLFMLGALGACVVFPLLFTRAFWIALWTVFLILLLLVSLGWITAGGMGLGMGTQYSVQFMVAGWIGLLLSAYGLWKLISV